MKQKDPQRRIGAIENKFEEKLKDIFDAFPFYVMLIDSDHHILLANNAVSSDLGVKPNEIIGKYCPKAVHGLDGPFPGCPLEESIKKGHAVVEKELFDPNSGQWVKSAIYPTKLKTQGGRLIFIHMTHNITELKRAREKITASLKEKDVMLKEIHHRVGNNMQIISSIINLQYGEIKNKIAIEILRETRDRIKSIANIHNMLYKSKDLAGIDLSYYIRDQIVYLFSSYGISTNVIKPKVNVGRFFLDINTAVPCGLIINELISNSLKHAFPEGKKGEICIELSLSKKGKHTIIVSDNGIGIPEDMDFFDTKSLGFQLVNQLVYQIQGNIELDRKAGTLFRISF